MRPPGAVCRLPGRRAGDQIGKEFLIAGAGQEVGQLALEPFAEASGKFFILAAFEAMEDERAGSGNLHSGDKWSFCLTSA